MKNLIKSILLGALITIIALTMLNAQSRTFVTPHLLDDFASITVAGYNGAATVAQAGVDPSVYKGMVITSTDLYDWANLQYAMYLEQQTGKPINLWGTFKGINKMIDLGKYNKKLVIRGNCAEVQATGAGTFSVFGRPQPTNVSDANVMIASKFDIENLTIKCSSLNQVGFEPGPTYGSRYEAVDVSGAGTGILLRFNLMATVNRCMWNDCKRGIILDILPGTSSTSTQNNGTTVSNCRGYLSANFVCDVGYGNYGSGGVTNESCIVEGYKCKVGWLVDGMGNTTTKRNYINNPHWETVQGTLPAGQGEAMIKVWMPDGVITISNCKNDYASVLLDVKSQGGWPLIELSNVSWWKAPADGKWINYDPASTGGASFKLINVRKTQAQIMSGFAGKAVTQKCDLDNGAHKVCIQ